MWCVGLRTLVCIVASLTSGFGADQGKILGLEGDAIRKVTSEYKQREDSLRAAAESGEYLAVCGHACCLRRFPLAVDMAATAVIVSLCRARKWAKYKLTAVV
jgi:hypothetical protein